MSTVGKPKVKSQINDNKVFKFFRELKAEIKRMTWPSKIDFKKAAIAVFTFCIIYVVIVSALDYGCNNLYKLIFK